MTKTRWILAAVLLVVLTCAGFYFILDDANSGVTRAKFDRIHDGMTFAEVEAIFGGPPAQVSGSFEWPGAQDGDEQREHATGIWDEGRGEAFLNFDQMGRVMSREWIPWHRLILEDFRRRVFPI